MRKRILLKDSDAPRLLVYSFDWFASKDGGDEDGSDEFWHQIYRRMSFCRAEVQPNRKRIKKK